MPKHQKRKVKGTPRKKKRSKRFLIVPYNAFPKTSFGVGNPTHVASMLSTIPKQPPMNTMFQVPQIPLRLKNIINSSKPAPTSNAQLKTRQNVPSSPLSHSANVTVPSRTNYRNLSNPYPYLPDGSDSSLASRQSSISSLPFLPDGSDSSLVSRRTSDLSLPFLLDGSDSSLAGRRSTSALSLPFLSDGSDSSLAGRQLSVSSLPFLPDGSDSSLADRRSNSALSLPLLPDGSDSSLASRRSLPNLTRPPSVNSIIVQPYYKRSGSDMTLPTRSSSRNAVANDSGTSLSSIQSVSPDPLQPYPSTRAHAPFYLTNGSNGSMSSRSSSRNTLANSARSSLSSDRSLFNDSQLSLANTTRQPTVDSLIDLKRNLRYSSEVDDPRDRYASIDEDPQDRYVSIDDVKPLAVSTNRMPIPSAPSMEPNTPSERNTPIGNKRIRLPPIDKRRLSSDMQRHRIVFVVLGPSAMYPAGFSFQLLASATSKLIEKSIDKMADVDVLDGVNELWVKNLDFSHPSKTTIVFVTPYTKDFNTYHIPPKALNELTRAYYSIFHTFRNQIKLAWYQADSSIPDSYTLVTIPQHTFSIDLRPITNFRMVKNHLTGMEGAFTQLERTSRSWDSLIKAASQNK